MRKLILGVAAAMGFAGAAHAADFVVVSSTDPNIARGLELTSGTPLAIAPGKSVTVIDVSGQVLRLAGAGGAITVPRRQAGNVNAERVAVLKLLVAPPRVRRAIPGLGRTCPPADLSQFDGIVTVAQVDGCLSTARTAFETYVLKAVGPETP